MPNLGKIKAISKHLGVPFKDTLRELYISKQFSAREIAEWIKTNTGVEITNRSIQLFLKSFGMIRSYSDAFKIAIKRGTKSYDKLRKTVKSSALRKGITPKKRYQIFVRDKWSCVLCGKTAKDDMLVVDHITPVVRGGSNVESNLRILCRECNTGKMLAEERI